MNDNFWLSVLGTVFAAILLFLFVHQVWPELWR